MSDTYPEPLTEIVEGEFTLEPAITGSLAEAVEHAITAQEPFTIGDHGLARIVPEAATLEVLDVRQHEDQPRNIKLQERTVGVPSFAEYTNIHKTDYTRVYIRDVYGSGQTMLVTDSTVATATIDDHAPQSEVKKLDPTRRSHSVELVLRPTTAARRWGAVFGSAIDQEQFLDLVVDGITEIAKPDGAILRDLISDLNAIRSAEVSSVVRSGGGGQIQVTENVKLTAGQGDKVDFPEEITIVLAPFAGIPDTITLTVRVRPKVRDNRVFFTLAAPGLDDALAAVVSAVAGEIEERTTFRPIWTP